MREQTASCPCGQSTFVVCGSPVAMFYCHCTICQSVYGLPRADVTVLWAKNVKLSSQRSLRFKKHRSPPALRRGVCEACGHPVVGFLTLAPFVELAFVPAQNYPPSSPLPAPSLHIFYGSRVADVDDALPKLNGYWPSQIATTQLILSRTLRSGAAT